MKERGRERVNSDTQGFFFVFLEATPFINFNGRKKKKEKKKKPDRCS